MKILAFDAALGACSAAVLASGKPLAHRFEIRARGHAETLVPMVEAVLREARLRFTDLELIAVTVGPGTFAGLRIGLATARGFGLATGVPLLGVTTLQAVAARVRRETGLKANVLAVHDARRGQVYAQLFEAGSPCDVAPVGHPAVCTPGAAAALLPGTNSVVTGSGADLVLETFVEKPGRVQRAGAGDQPDALDVALLAQAMGFPAERAIPPAPLYLRPPDAKLPAVS